jgi:hypothetical protein
VNLKQVSIYRNTILAARECKVLFLFYSFSIEYKKIYKLENVGSQNATYIVYL